MSKPRNKISMPDGLSIAAQEIWNELALRLDPAALSDVELMKDYAEAVSLKAQIHEFLNQHGWSSTENIGTSEAPLPVLTVREEVKQFRLASAEVSRLAKQIIFKA